MSRKLTFGALVVACASLFLGYFIHSEFSSAPYASGAPKTESDVFSSALVENGSAASGGGREELERRGFSPNSLAETSGRIERLISSGSTVDWEIAIRGQPIPFQVEFLEAVGASGSGSASEFLRSALKSDHQDIRRAAIRGLAMTNRDIDILFLESLIADSQLAVEETTEAALALGASKSLLATQSLTRAYNKATSEEVIECVLIGLAQRPFTQTERFFRELLSRSEVPAIQKQDAIQSLGQFDSVTDAFFEPLLANPDPGVRQGAYQGIASLSQSNLGPRLLSALKTENEPALRVHIYEALSSKTAGDFYSLSQIAKRETEPSLVACAGRAVARCLLENSASASAVATFEADWVPGLAKIAMDGSREDACQALVALSFFSGTERVSGHLSKIAESADDDSARALADKILARKKR
jgi:hypothetical protein